MKGRIDIGIQTNVSAAVDCNGACPSDRGSGLSMGGFASIGDNCSCGSLLPSCKPSIWSGSLCCGPSLKNGNVQCCGVVRNPTRPIKAVFKPTCVLLYPGKVYHRMRIHYGIHLDEPVAV